MKWSQCWVSQQDIRTFIILKRKKVLGCSFNSLVCLNLIFFVQSCSLNLKLPVISILRPNLFQYYLINVLRKYKFNVHQIENSWNCLIFPDSWTNPYHNTKCPTPKELVVVQIYLKFIFSQVPIDFWSLENVHEK